MEARYAKVENPNPDDFYVPTDFDSTWGRTLDTEWTDHAPQREHRPRREAIDAALALRAAVDTAIEAVSAVASCMDSEIQSVDQRWTTRTIGHLRQLRGAIVRGYGADICPSALPMIRAGVPDALRKHTRHVMERMEEVKSAACGSGAKPRDDESSGGVLKPDGWTRAVLIAQAKHDDAACSGTTFDTIRKAAEIPPAEMGGGGAQRRFSIAQLRRLIAAAEDGNFRDGGTIAAAWRGLLPDSYLGESQLNPKL